MKKLALLVPLLALAVAPALAEIPATNTHPHFHGGGWGWDGGAFFTDFYRAVAEERPDGNLVVSPFSAASVFGMLATGARGESANALCKALRFARLQPCRGGDASGAAAETPPSPDEVARPFRNLLSKLAEGPGKTEGIALETTASLWTSPDFAPRTDFAKRARRDFSARVESLPLDESGRAAINATIAKATHGLVPELFTRPFGRDTVLVLAGTVYLKAAWEEAFDPARSFDAPFHAPGGDRPARFMTRASAPCEIADLDGFSALLLPYAGGALHLLVLLPDEGADLRAFERDLTLARLGKTVSALRKEKATVVLPRFSFATEELDLLGPLRALGAGPALDAPDFSGIAAGSLSVGSAVQTARIAVDEAGAEAAAATGVTMLRSIAPRPRTFVADRPFLFAVVRFEFDDRIHTPVCLFLGRVADPATNAPAEPKPHADSADGAKEPAP